MTTFREALRECMEAELERGRPTVEDIVACAYRDHPKVLDAESEILVRKAAGIAVKNLLREQANEQQDRIDLPGISAPAAIAIRTDKGLYYVRTDKATWPELLTAKAERADHITAARAALDKYQAFMDQVRPYMEAHPDRTVSDALLLMSGRKAS